MNEEVVAFVPSKSRLYKKMGLARVVGLLVRVCSEAAASVSTNTSGAHWETRLKNASAQKCDLGLQCMKCKPIHTFGKYYIKNLKVC